MAPRFHQTVDPSLSTIVVKLLSFLSSVMIRHS